MTKTEKSGEVALSAAAAADFAHRVTAATTVEEQAALLVWLQQPSDARYSNITALSKAIEAQTITANSDALWPVLKTVVGELKHHCWDDRSFKARFGIVGATAGFSAFGWAGAGIAALGGATGLPLSIVLGAGSLAAGALIEELSGKGGND